MLESTASLRQRYRDSVRDYVVRDGEALRELALALGRQALEEGLGLLDLALLQRESVGDLPPGQAQDRAAEFFAEVLAPYEMRLRGAQEAQARLLSANQDLEQRVAERSRGLREKEAQLHQARKMEAIGRLAGGIAHDFNNLLTVICGYIDICLETHADADKAAQDLRRARKAADQAAALTRQLLAFSRRQGAAPRAVDLNGDTAETLAMLKRLLRENVSLDFEPANPPCRVWMDPGQLTQVLMNLVINARDALPGGGRIRVSASSVALSAEHLLGHPHAQPGRFGLLTISDNGVGMDADTQARIFEPFFSTKEPGRGTGLGLATVYGIVEQGGGLIALHSEPGAGSTFKVYLPLAEGPAAAAAEPGEGRLDGGHETLLLVEDDPDVRAFAHSVLSQAGYRVLEAGRPSEALALARTETPDLLVTDMGLPEMDGRALYERLRQARPQLRVLFVSGLPSDAAIALEGLGDRYRLVAKPFSPAELAQAVRAVLDAGGRP